VQKRQQEKQVGGYGGRGIPLAAETEEQEAVGMAQQCLEHGGVVLPWVGGGGLAALWGALACRHARFAQVHSL
jgi:hypothetical protein